MNEKPINPEELPYYYSNIPKDLPDRTNYLNALEKSFYDDLKTNPDYIPFFKDYNPDTIDDFCRRYASHKRRLAEHYEMNEKLAEVPKELSHRRDAEEVFEMILQKKLFDLQLLWRAEQITLNEIQLGIDFMFWEEHINYCSFLEEVTQAEIDVLKDFLKENNYQDHVDGCNCQWQNYEEMMEKNEEGDREEMPEWFEFYDNRFGTGRLLLLPDIRGKKEDHYRDMYFEWQKTQPVPVNLNPYVEPPPFLFSSLENFGIFIKQFEHDYLKTAQNTSDKLYHQDDTESYVDEQLYNAIAVLNDAPGIVNLRSDLNWKEALLEGAARFENNNVIDELQTVYEDYLMQREMKIGVQAGDKKTEYDDYFLRPVITEQILKGRSLAGEPEDLDF